MTIGADRIELFLQTVVFFQQMAVAPDQLTTLFRESHHRFDDLLLSIFLHASRASLDLEKVKRNFFLRTQPKR